MNRIKSGRNEKKPADRRGADGDGSLRGNVGAERDWSAAPPTAWEARPGRRRAAKRPRRKRLRKVRTAERTWKREIVDENAESSGRNLHGGQGAGGLLPARGCGARRPPSSDQVGSLSSGDEIDVVGETTGSDGHAVVSGLAARLNGETVSGYIRSDLVEVTETAAGGGPCGGSFRDARRSVPSEHGERVHGRIQRQLCGRRDGYRRQRLVSERQRQRHQIQGQRSSECAADQ